MRKLRYIFSDFLKYDYLIQDYEYLIQDYDYLIQDNVFSFKEKWFIRIFGDYE